eukprot:NODE_282_length_11867_cov_0.266995.p3 type:complete len:145 gc:universal NODE_282_length_11867_cov_0.266995:11738-11304(-)
MEPNFDFSILREEFLARDIQNIVREMSDFEIDTDAGVLLNKSAIFFLAKLISEAGSADEDALGGILMKWNFEQFDKDAKLQIKCAEPEPVAQSSSFGKLPSMKSMDPGLITLPVPNVSTSNFTSDNNEQSMQMKLMGLLKKKFH